MKKGLRVLLCLFFSIFSIVMCISFNLDNTKEEIVESKTNIVGYVEPKKELVVKNNINIEVNTKLPTVKDYFTNYNLKDSGVIKYYLNDKEVKKDYVLKNINTYDVVIIVDKNKYNSKLNIVDTKAPTLKTKNITIYENQKYDVKSFVSSCEDNSKNSCKLSYTDSKMGKYTKAGTYKISISAKDNDNNTSISNATLTIKTKITSNSNKTSNKAASTKNTSNKSNSKYKTTYELKDTAVKEVKNNKKLADEVIKYTNTYRKEVNAKELKYDEKLSIVATIRVIEIAYYDKFDHVRPNGLSFSSVIRDLNIDYGYCGENIAYGYIDAEEVSVAWKESRGHYENMINTHYNKIGIGYYEYNNTIYWAQIFSD